MTPHLPIAPEEIAEACLGAAGSGTAAAFERTVADEIAAQDNVAGGDRARAASARNVLAAGVTEEV